MYFLTQIDLWAFSLKYTVYWPNCFLCDFFKFSRICLSECHRSAHRPHCVNSSFDVQVSVRTFSDLCAKIGTLLQGLKKITGQFKKEREVIILKWGQEKNRFLIPRVWNERYEHPRQFTFCVSPVIWGEN